MKSKTWFTADKKGLEQITRRNIERRGVGILIAELFQNSIDANATSIVFEIDYNSANRDVQLICEDNGDGFHDLDHAFTMFAPSIKKSDPTKAGRFNVGEKFVLSICKYASIATTCGTIEFNGDGTRERWARRKRGQGTRVELYLKLTRKQCDELIDSVEHLLIPKAVRVIINGVSQAYDAPTSVFTASLPTEAANEDGVMRKTQRKTTVQLHDVSDGEVPMLFELGIPVVELAGGDKYHVNVMQKVPLNVDRDNVTPSYLRLIRVHVLNNMHEELTEQDVSTTWVQEAASDKRTVTEATKQVLKVQYGEDAVVANPFDKEANAKAVADGRTLIPTNALTRGFRDNLYDRGQVKTSSQLYSQKTLVGCKHIRRDQWNDKMNAINGLATYIATRAAFITIKVQMIDAPDASTVADYERAKSLMRFNMSHSQLPTTLTGIVDLIIHELGHAFEGNHLSTNYYHALTKIGAQLAVDQLDDRASEQFKLRCHAFVAAHAN